MDAHAREILDDYAPTFAPLAWETFRKSIRQQRQPVPPRWQDLPEWQRWAFMHAVAHILWSMDMACHQKLEEVRQASRQEGR